MVVFIYAILEGLPPKYALVISVMKANLIILELLVVEVEVLLCYDSRAVRFNNKIFSPSLHYI